MALRVKTRVEEAGVEIAGDRMAVVLVGQRPGEGRGEFPL
jgi:ethanolamine ammonia-lyase small subunit